jgi:hypothetical protein
MIFKVDVKPRKFILLRRAIVAALLLGGLFWSALIMFVVWALGGDITPEF